MTVDARTQPLAQLETAQHRTADLMDADGRGTQDPAQLLNSHAFLAAYGLDSMDQWSDVRRAYMAPDGAGHQAWKAWVLECRAVRAEMEKLFLPSWLDSPSLTSADVRAIADRFAIEAA
ncbi:hypothetical protein [Streptomyces violaceusniger]|uniref:hypothetical protein n=1 Tax=Streptomyces violaceusniger TaxID=68280 RepID=UPI00381CDDA9